MREFIESHWRLVTETALAVPFWFTVILFIFMNIFWYFNP